MRARPRRSVLIGLTQALALALTAAVAPGCTGAVATQDGPDGGAGQSGLDGGVPDPDVPRDVTVLVDVAHPGATIASDAVGLSLGYPSIGPYLGRRPDALNTVFLQLLKNLGEGTLRVGGDSTDTSCWRPRSGAALPSGCAIEISENSLSIIAKVMGQADWRALLGVDLNHYSTTTAVAFAHDGIGPAFSGALRPGLLGLQYGNEPDLYVAQKRRPAGYDQGDFVSQWNGYGKALAADPTAAGMGAAGPTYGARSTWIADLDKFVTGAGDRLGLVTIHDYPLNRCGQSRPTMDDLLDPATLYDSQKRITLAAEVAAARGLDLQMDEVGSISCGGVDGVSNAFGSALWTVDYILTALESGAARVNLHSAPGAYYDPIVSSSSGPADGPWTYSVRVLPAYYGMLMASRAAGGRLLSARVTDGAFALSAHAVRAEDGTTLVFLINKDPMAGGMVAVTPSEVRGPAQAVVLKAPSLDSHQADVTLGGAQVDLTTGRIDAPRTEAIEPASSHGTYVVPVPNASAVMLIIPG